MTRGAFGRGAAQAACAALTVAMICAGSAGASELIYSNLPAKPSPGNVVSEPFEAASASQFGGEIETAGGARTAQTLEIGMSSWACQSGSWNGPTECVTAKGAKFELPLTVDIYAVGPGNSPGALIKTVTETVRIPYRASQNNHRCTGALAGDWYDMRSKQCFRGLFVVVTVRLGKLALPARSIVTAAFNTSDYGADPQRPRACNSTAGGCPYDSLNVGLTEPVSEAEPEPVAPSVGADPAAPDAFLNSSAGGSYCDGGLGGTGSLRLDAGCWTGYQPLLAIKGF